MALKRFIKTVNRGMIGFDLALATAALTAPAGTVKLLTNETPKPDEAWLFRRCAPIWYTFALAHLVADRRGKPRDWWALSWLRGTELATDILWAASPTVSVHRRSWLLRAAGPANLLMAIGFAYLSERDKK